jgi:hypothetical protein
MLALPPFTPPRSWPNFIHPPSIRRRCLWKCKVLARTASFLFVLMLVLFAWFWFMACVGSLPTFYHHFG